MSTSSFKVRTATLADASTIAQFNIAMALETENLQLNSDTVTKGVMAILTRPSLGQYFVAVCQTENNDNKEEDVAGCCMVRDNWFYVNYYNIVVQRF